MRERFKHAGETMRINDAAMTLPTGQVLSGRSIVIEDYWQNISGQSWINSDANPTVLMYAMRTGLQGGIPIDNEVVYGKVAGLGVLVHVSELEEIKQK